MKVSDLLTDESKWCKGWFAKDIEGKACYTNDKKAVRFCLTGAMIKCYGESNPNFFNIMSKVRDYLKCFPSDWNDKPERTFSEVRELVVKLDL